MVDEDPEEHWIDASGNVLPPSRWISQDAEEEEDTYGRCIGLRILGQFLHEEAGGWFPSLRLPPPDELLTMQAVFHSNTLTSFL